MTKEFINSHTVGSIISERKSLIDAHISDKIQTVLKYMKDNHILSVPIYDNQFDFIGFVSVFDLMTYVTFGDYQNFNVKETAFSMERLDHPVGDVIVPDRDATSVYVFEENAPLSKLVEGFSFGVHRVLIKSSEDPEKYFILSQSDLAKFLYQNREHLDDETLTKLVEAENDPDFPIHSISTAATALSGIRMMSKYGLNAVPVVHQVTNEIVTTFSASDLKKVDVHKLGNVHLPVLDFLWLIHHDILKPISIVDKTITLEEVLFIVTSNRIHRVWITNEDGTLKGVSSLTDIIFNFLDITDYI